MPYHETRRIIVVCNFNTPFFYDSFEAQHKDNIKLHLTPVALYEPQRC